MALTHYTLLAPLQLSELRLMVERLSRDKASLLPCDCMASTNTLLAFLLLLPSAAV
jgi:hypothetical protein